LKCSDLKDLILLHAAGVADPAESEMVRQHLSSGCPVCAGALAEAEATLASLALSLPLETPSPALKQRIMAGLEKPRASEPMRIQPAAAPSPPWWMQLAIPSALAASIAAAITLLFTMRLMPRPADNASSASWQRTVVALGEELAQQQDEISSLRKGSQLASWAAEPQLKIFNLSGTENQPADARARIFWDSKQGMWHFFASGMKPAPAGKTYELWFVSTDGKTKLPAGSFDPQSGSAYLETAVPSEIAPRLTIAAVTDEPAGTNIESPTGTFQLIGKLPAN